MISKDTIDRIMDATRIEEVIGEFVSLKKRGANHIGCCPFHNEKTPSFYVSPSKGIFKCFGCGKSGNAVGFLMDHEHYTYPEALHWLADKYHIQIEEEQLTEEQKERQTERDGLFHVSEFAQKYFADLLYNNELGRNIGLAYFHQRGLSDDIIKTFGLGYCLDEWDNFTTYARRNGYSDAVLEKTGLTIFKEDGKCFDRFKGRVMFPIYSISGRVLGFSGRTLSKEKQVAKYVNSPDSDIYNKSHILYGLYQARNAIGKAGKCYLVEGNVDVVSMHQSGVCNTVASCGTSLTIEQIRLIKRYTPNVTVLYDGDSAGIKAALRAVNLLFEEGMHVRVVLFPDGEDPDSYAQKYGSTQLQDYLRDHEENFVQFKTRVLLEDVESDPIRKAEVLKEMVRTIALVPDMLERQEYVKQTAARLRTSETILTQELAKTMAANAQKAWKEQQRNEQQPTPPADQPQPPAPGQPSPGNADTTPLPPSADQYSIVPGLDKDSSPTSLQITSQERTANDAILNDPTASRGGAGAEAQERHLVRLLITSGNKMILQDGVDDEGNPCPIELSLAEVVVAELTENELSFSNPVYQQIYTLYRDAVENGQPLPDANLFAQHTDSILRNTALTLMLTQYQISDQWRDKKHILVPGLETHLRRDLEETILTFKQKKVEHELEQNAFQIRSCTDPDDTVILMAQRKQLIQTWQAVCQKLGRVVV
ncbi:MAG: DNA primase [Bacteroidales bacterium]|nr:DNA primase [Bacteroidales bacterium]